MIDNIAQRRVRKTLPLNNHLHAMAGVTPQKV